MTESHKYFTPADFGAIHNQDTHLWSWWVGDQLRLVVRDDANFSRAYDIQFFGSSTEGINATQLRQLQATIGKALKCRKALLKQAKETSI